MADQVRLELRADKTGALPVHVALEQLDTSASVAFRLLPLPLEIMPVLKEKQISMMLHYQNSNPSRRQEAAKNRQDRSNLPAGLD